MVRVRTECCHGFTALTVVLVTPFSILGIVYPPIQYQFENSRSKSAVVAHFTACIAAAAIASIISAIQSRPRQSLRGGALESSGGFEAGTSKPTMRDSSIRV